MDYRNQEKIIGAHLCKGGFGIFIKIGGGSLKSDFQNMEVIS
jgi:hypothetical protein